MRPKKGGRGVVGSLVCHSAKPQPRADRWPRWLAVLRAGRQDRWPCQDRERLQLSR